jgi:hypothetical protein
MIKRALRLSGLIIIFMSILPPTAICSGVQAEFVYVEPANNQLFSWLRSGELYWIRFTDGRPGAYLYRKTSGELVILTGHVKDVSELLSSSLPDPLSAQKFVGDKLEHVVLSMFAPSHSYLINDVYCRNRELLPSAAWVNLSDFGKLRLSNTVLLKYAKSSKHQIQDGKWSFTLFITFHDGSIERWQIDGAVFPFKISNLIKVIVEQKETVVPIPE